MPKAYPTQMCKCFYEPMGANGLEGFRRGELYGFQERPGGIALYSIHNKLGYNGYMGTCGPMVFNRYFSRIIT